MKQFLGLLGGALLIIIVVVLYRASGVIEKMADLVVKKRMKRQGMRWSQAGANNLLALRTQYLNAQASQPPHRTNPTSSPH